MPEPATLLPMHLADLATDLAAVIKRIDMRRRQATGARTGTAYQPGIEPHPETQVLALMTDVPYPGASRQKCDLCIGGPWAWGEGGRDQDAAACRRLCM